MIKARLWAEYHIDKLPINGVYPSQTVLKYSKYTSVSALLTLIGRKLCYIFATIARQNGVDIKAVSGMLGHFSAGVILDTYAHVTTAAQKEAAETIGQVLTMQK